MILNGPFLNDYLKLASDLSLEHGGVKGFYIKPMFMGSIAKLDKHI